MCTSALEFSLKIGSDGRLHVRLDDGSEAVLPLRGRGIPMPNPPNGVPRNTGKMFSPIEAAILKAATFNWQTGAELAEKTGQALSSSFRSILSNLSDRDWLESGRSGYRRRAGIDYSSIDGHQENHRSAE